MKARMSSSICAAGMLALCTTAFAQQAGQAGQPPQQQPTTPPAARASADGAITVTGCVQREADYRQARDAGKGGVAGTGVGAGNEFVLTNASASTSTGAAAANPTGTSGAAAAAYELTGANEGQAAAFVGKRVEITGKLKAADVGASGQPTGGATAGQPPSGVDVASKDLKLRELEVTSVREATGTCPAGK
jgi:hypothetical protein